MNIADLRQEYMRARLDETEVARDPFEQFNRWFDEAIKAEHPMLNAMTLATVSAEGRPSARIVLLKGVDNGGFVFFTNYKSRKGRELTASQLCEKLGFGPDAQWTPVGDLSGHFFTQARHKSPELFSRFND